MLYNKVYMTYFIGTPYDDIELNFSGVYSLLGDEWEVTYKFEKESFLRIRDGQTIRMFNKDIERYEVELRDYKIKNILNCAD